MKKILTTENTENIFLIFKQNTDHRVTTKQGNWNRNVLLYSMFSVPSVVKSLFLG